MSQTITVNNQEEWLKVLGKGMVTIPKQWRDELGLNEGDVVKAKKEGNRLVIEPQNALAPYRVYSIAEIDTFLKEDELPKSFLQRVEKDLSLKNSK